MHAPNLCETNSTNESSDRTWNNNVRKNVSARNRSRYRSSKIRTRFRFFTAWQRDFPFSDLSPLVYHTTHASFSEKIIPSCSRSDCRGFASSSVASIFRKMKGKSKRRYDGGATSIFVTLFCYYYYYYYYLCYIVLLYIIVTSCYVTLCRVILYCT